MRPPRLSLAPALLALALLAQSRHRPWGPPTTPSSAPIQRQLRRRLRRRLRPAAASTSPTTTTTRSIGPGGKIANERPRRRPLQARLRRRRRPLRQQLAPRRRQIRTRTLRRPRHGDRLRPARPASPSTRPAATSTSPTAPTSPSTSPGRHAGEAPIQIGLGSLGEAYGVAVSDYPATAGDLYVPDAADNTVKVFRPGDQPRTPIEEMNGVGTPQGAFTYLIDGEIAVDNSPTSPSYGHVFVLDAIGHGLSEHPEAVLDEFNAAGTTAARSPASPTPNPRGSRSNDQVPHGNVYVTSGNTEGSSVFRLRAHRPRPHAESRQRKAPGGARSPARPPGSSAAQPAPPNTTKARPSPSSPAPTPTRPSPAGP